MSLEHFCVWLSDTSFSNWLRFAPYPYPILIMIHVITIALFGGVVVLGNLRVLGYAMKETPASEVFNQFRMWKWAGFASFLITGVLMSISDPMEYYTNPMYWLSMVLLVAAGINAWVFHRGAERRIAEWDQSSAAPSAAKTWAICSLILWISMVGVGRAIAFF
jgi:hypothetical protein